MTMQETGQAYKGYHSHVRLPHFDAAHTAQFILLGPSGAFWEPDHFNLSLRDETLPCLSTFSGIRSKPGWFLARRIGPGQALSQRLGCLGMRPSRTQSVLRKARVHVRLGSIKRTGPKGPIGMLRKLLRERPLSKLEGIIFGN